MSTKRGRGLIYARSSFLEGMAQVFDLGGTLSAHDFGPGEREREIAAEARKAEAEARKAEAEARKAEFETRRAEAETRRADSESRKADDAVWKIDAEAMRPDWLEGVDDMRVEVGDYGYYRIVKTTTKPKDEAKLES